MSIKIFIASWFVFVIFSCKHTHDVDPLLLDADKIQHEAIALGEQADSILDVRFAQGTNAWNIDTLRLLKSAVADWRLEMVAVPGLDHDHNHTSHAHDDHAHDDHDHDHNHDHGDHIIGAQLTPSEIKKVQQEWKDRIEKILQSLK